MTKLTPEEDMAFMSPEQIEADIKAAEIDAIWKPLAEKLGWKWSSDANGYKHEDFFYFTTKTAEQACQCEGFGDILKAIEKLEEND